MAPPRPPLEIDDPDDPRIADYRNIRERDLVGRRGLFVAEGEVVLRLLARAPHLRQRRVRPPRCSSAWIASRRLKMRA